MRASVINASRYAHRAALEKRAFLRSSPAGSARGVAAGVSDQGCTLRRRELRWPRCSSIPRRCTVELFPAVEGHYGHIRLCRFPVRFSG